MQRSQSLPGVHGQFCPLTQKSDRCGARAGQFTPGVQAQFTPGVQAQLGPEQGQSTPGVHGQSLPGVQQVTTGFGGSGGRAGVICAGLSSIWFSSAGGLAPRDPGTSPSSV